MRSRGMGFGIGFSFRPKYPPSGGTPTPPFAFPEDEMLLGMGLAGINSYNGYYPFANVLWNAARWIRQSGSTAFKQEWGELSPLEPTDVFQTDDIFYCKFAEGDGTTNLPAGTYTVLNPDGLKIGVGWGGTPNLTGWKTDPEFTFTKSGSVIALYAEGSVTNINGPIQIIMPGCRDAFIAGDHFNPDFITFLSGLNVSCLRFMDWLLTYGDMTEEWSEVPVGLPIALNAPVTAMSAKVPFQLIVELCNRLMINPWVCMPVRAKQSYWDGVAAYFSANLDPTLRVYVEEGNEVWNPGLAYIDARSWMDYYAHTEYEMTTNPGINGWTNPGHGLATGNIISVYLTKENYTQSPSGQVWPLGWGNGFYVEVADANNFKLFEDVARTIPVPPDPSDMSASAIAKRNNYNTLVKVIYKNRGEAGKTAGVDTNYGKVSLEMWNRFDAIMGRNRVLHVLGTQGVSGSVTTNRLAPTGVTAATDMVAPASYYSGDWFIGLVDVASGQFTPKAWSRRAGDVVRVAVYSAGSTPTLAEVNSGSGTGYIAHRDMTIATQDASTYTSGSAITGLSNGTDYEVFVLMTSVSDGFKWLATDMVTASASASTVTISDSYDAMATRARRNIAVLQMSIITTQRNALNALGLTDMPLVFYECGSDYFGPGQNIPTELQAWREGYTQSVEAGDAFAFFYDTMAAAGVKLANQFVDINASIGVFNIAESFSDTSDYRYLKFVGYDGSVPEVTPFNIADIVASNVLIEPSYPALVHTFADPTLTYSIFNGDENGNFDIVGDELRIVNGTSINWATPTARSLVIEASNGTTNDYFTISFATGFSWYEADAKFAWSSIDDNDNTQINPIIGNALPRVTGSGATIGGGLWDMDGNVYSVSSAMGSNVDYSKPFLVAGVFDKDNHTTGVAWQPFSPLFFEMSGAAFQARINFGSNYNCPFATTMPTGEHVFWIYCSVSGGTATLRFGYDQVEAPLSGTITVPSFTGSGTTRMRVGAASDSPASSNMKHGAKQIVNRTGMTLADALEIVADMQTLHGI